MSVPQAELPPVDWMTPEGIREGVRRLQAMAVAAEETAVVCRRLARVLAQDPPDPPEGNS